MHVCIIVPFFKRIFGYKNRKHCSAWDILEDYILEDNIIGYGKL